MKNHAFLSQKFVDLVHLLTYTVCACMRPTMSDKLLRRNLKSARLRWGSTLTSVVSQLLKAYTEEFQLSVLDGDLLLLTHGWYELTLGSYA
jgi:hypothetical protein